MKMKSSKNLTFFLLIFLILGKYTYAGNVMETATTTQYLSIDVLSFPSNLSYEMKFDNNVSLCIRGTYSLFPLFGASFYSIGIGTRLYFNGNDETTFCGLTFDLVNQKTFELGDYEEKKPIIESFVLTQAELGLRRYSNMVNFYDIAVVCNLYRNQYMPSISLDLVKKNN